jgi:hypothetical protein
VTKDQKSYLRIMSAVCTVMARQDRLRIDLADVIPELPFALDEAEVRRICDEVGEEIRIDVTGRIHLTTVGPVTDAR